MNWYKKASKSFYISFSDGYGNLEVSTGDGRKTYTFTDVDIEQEKQLEKMISFQKWNEVIKILKELKKQQNAYESVLSPEPVAI